MKTFLILLTTLTLFSAAPLSAAGPKGQTSTTCAVDAKGVRSQLSRLLTFSPDKITALSGGVNFIVRLHENGRLEVLDIYGDAAYSVEQVRQVLERSRLLIAPSLAGRAFRVGLQYGQPYES